MTLIQKQHWFNIIVVSIALALFLGSIPFVGFTRAGSSLGLIGFIGFGFAFYWRRDKTKVLADERDRAIALQANMWAFVTIWTYFFTGCAVLCFVLGKDGVISMRALQAIVFLAWGIQELTRSIATLMQYRQIA